MEMKGKILSGIIIVFLLIFCIHSPSYGESIRGVTDTTIKVGAIFDLTGPLATIIKPIVEALRTYTRHTNDQGGINGRKIKLIVEDDRYSIPAAVSAFKKLLYRDKIFALLGPGSTGEARVLMDQIMKQKLPSIPMAADDDMITPYKRYIFLSIDTYRTELGVLYDYIIETSKPKKPKIALALVDSGVKAVGIRETKRWSRFFGIDIDVILVPVNVLDTTSEVLSLKRKKADHIIVGHSIPTIALFLKDVKRYNVDAKVFASYSGTSEDVIKIAKNAADDFYGVHPFSSWYDDTPGMAEVRKITLDYHPGTEKPYRSKNYTLGWVMTKILFEGLTRAGKDLDEERLVDALETFRDFSTRGMCGPITYTSESHEGLQYVKVFKADPKTETLVPISDWRKAPEDRETK
ncbi:MAG: ABC transporter substrate-binding protein [Thermodesulfobacteriota bacterium]|nr:ABC transporter substrate-binding protein [Thermodesulfobacteriota bacterium]